MGRKLFAWNPVRRFLRFDESPRDDSGEDLMLWNGSPLPEDQTIHLVKPRKGKLHDFLYTPLLLLFVSQRALEVVQSAHVPNIRVNRLNLRDPDGRIIRDNYYWVNVALVVPVMDEQRSVFTREAGGMRQVDRLVLDDSRIPPDDLFVIAEISQTVCSEPLVQAIQKAGLSGAKFEPLDETFRWPA